MENKQYILSVTDLQGRRQNIRIKKPNAEEAYNEAVSLGYSDIDLRTDNYAAADCILKKKDWGVEGDYSDVLTPDESIEISNCSNSKFFFFILKKYLYIGFVLFFVVFLLETYKFYDTGFFNMDWTFILPFILFFVGLAIYQAFFGSFGKFGNLVYYKSWGEWEKAIHYSGKLKGKMPEWDRLIREAVCVSGLGRLEEALAMVAHLENSQDISKAMYFARIVDIYDVAHQYDKVYECNKKAFELDPKEHCIRIEYALCLLRMNKENEYALELISEIENEIQGDLIKAYIPHAKGIYLINKGQFQEALFELEIARKKIAQFVNGGSNGAPGLDFNQAYIAIAHARLGNYEKAEKEAVPAIKRLKALNDKRLISKLEDALRRKI